MGKPKDFAEKLVNKHNLAVQAWYRAMSHGHPEEGFKAEVDAAERDLLQALRVPSPHSEDFPTVHDQFMMAAVQGQIAYQGLEGCGADEGCKDVAVWAKELADACMELRKATSTPEGAQP